jgi:hypothetical protein
MKVQPIKYEKSDAKIAKDALLKCPKCGETDVVEVSDGVVTRWHYEWNTAAGRFKLRSKDSECFGYTELQCDNCGHSFDQEEYDKFGEFVAYDQEI